MPTDQDLLTAWAAGDRDAGEELIRRYFDAIYRFFASKIDDDVSDLVQRTFLGCLEGRERFRGEASLRAYLYGIARHELYGYFRQRRRDERIDFMVSSLGDLGPSPSSWAARNQEHLRLQHALRELPVDLQIALELYYFEDVRGGDLTAALEVPAGTVRSRLRRGIEALRELLINMRGADEPPGEAEEEVAAWAQHLEREAS